MKQRNIAKELSDQLNKGEKSSLSPEEIDRLLECISDPEEDKNKQEKNSKEETVMILQILCKDLLEISLSSHDYAVAMSLQPIISRLVALTIRFRVEEEESIR